ncbi:succinic semialdehyde dehydrogenase [Cellulomonas aerilata]|uniref:Succinic semialdehyde dehydrogenase n=1 Tax=Cellulomonas aerilata TaxID=515326 RepID=A0A512D8Y3_9CELL|nr:succinic semialdehyde dehydrogenase [Cellulomonas aerilata]GEO32938.1 succinic semialdehyde dehydrogenase [Cellulomonas aerilata]
MADAVPDRRPTVTGPTSSSLGGAPATGAPGGASRSALPQGLAEALLPRVVAGGRGGSVTVLAPFTGLPLVDVPLSTTDDVAEAASRARAAQVGWAAMPVARRAAVLLAFHDRVLGSMDEILDLVQLECGKARLSAVEEVGDVAQIARHHARRAARYLAPRRVPSLVPVLTTAEVRRHPLGLIGVVAPFNYPFTLSVGDALPALVAGNAVLVKPDTRTVLSALWGVAQLEAAGLPRGLVQVVVGEAEVGAAVVAAVDHVVFTGSTATGREVAAQAGRRLIGATLELGGKNPLYVADDVDVEVAAEGAVRACFAGTGQLCVSVERLYVHERVADDFQAAFVRRTRALTLGPALDFSADVGTLTSPAQLAKVTGHVTDAVARGATVLAGGRARPDLGPLFFEPTVLADVPDEAAVAREETFGPVVSIRTVRSDDEAVAAMNDTRYGLNASVWTRSVARGRALAARVEAGTVNVNDGYVTAWAAGGAPQGGVKDSGIGARHGAASIAAVTRTQTIGVQRAVHGPRWAAGLAGGGGLGFGRMYAGPGERTARLLTTMLRVSKAVHRA